MDGWTLLVASELKSQFTLFDIIYKKGAFISEGVDWIQSLTSAEKRLQWPLSAYTKLSSKKITIYSIQLLENKFCISANKRPRHLFNFEALKCVAY